MKFDRQRRYSVGDTRVIERFTWVPLRLGVMNTDIRETRWLEKVKLYQVYDRYYDMEGGGYEGWRNLYFLV